MSAEQPRRDAAAQLDVGGVRRRKFLAGSLFGQPPAQDPPAGVGLLDILSALEGWGFQPATPLWV